MPDSRWGGARWAGLLGLAALTMGLGAGRLSYHEAFVAQAARELLASGDVVVPTIGGRPWLEKPPLAVWLAGLSAELVGGGAVTATAARLPSALAGALLVVAVAVLGTRRFGKEVGLLAGLVQATTSWTVARGWLAEADMLLACLIAWAVVAFDRLREALADDDPAAARWRRVFFGCLGVSGLAKGTGFGAVLFGALAVVVLAWDRDRRTLRRLRSGVGWLLAAALALTWPLLAALRHPAVLKLWTLHVSDRLADQPEHFAGGSPWWGYVPALLIQTLPWTPLALAGAWRSLVRAAGRSGQGGGDRLLWAWAVGPMLLLSLATVKNAHYAIHALPPWSLWAALGLSRLGARLQARGWSADRLRRGARGAFTALGLAYALGFSAWGAWFDRRGTEWAFYEAAGRAGPASEPLALLYDDWDRKPYPTPFGPVPHDLAVRLYYLNRPACWRFGITELAADPPVPAPSSFAVVGRDRDLPDLRQLGRVETLARGPDLRARASRVNDRAFRLFRVTPGPAEPPRLTRRDGDGP